MLIWKRYRAGTYMSSDSRFEITKQFNHLYGNHWVLCDNEAKHTYERFFDFNTMNECKSKAEEIMCKEEHND